MWASSNWYLVRLKPLSVSGSKLSHPKYQTYLEIAYKNSDDNIRKLKNKIAEVKARSVSPHHNIDLPQSMSHEGESKLVKCRDQIPSTP